MKEQQIRDILRWVSEQGLQGLKEQDLLAGFCEQCLAAGLPVDRALGIIDTLHPEFEGRAYQWLSDSDEIPEVLHYGSTTSGEALANWQRSVFFQMLQQQQGERRIRLALEQHVPFAPLERLRAEGHADCLCFVHHFTDRGRVGAMDCFYSNWTTKDDRGFSDEDMEALRVLVPTLALAVKAASCMRIIGTLADVYLGEDAGRRVVEGRIERGAVERIEAVMWFSDLRNFTRISDSIAPEEIIPFLNDYSGTVIGAIHDHGGSVLKLIGDGVLAIFNDGKPADACSAAIAAEQQLRLMLMELNTRRLEEGKPVTDVSLGLHIGEVFYGNIGSQDRLDFTVVGPAVNEVSRIVAMCRSVERQVIMSSEFIAACPPLHRANTVSLGRFALRGIARAKELFTWDPEIAAG
ncbi:adenylate/guanylate cyclase domain-containing protein [Sinorhizobium alkalisoli]|uniref:Adenylate cyclase n=1 Tax=Sinorhizobium alkalisoli TaxID=1752398 RepID=A0A1E3VAF7_9HYPH|nr:adenylate/guanylate cyclase domain-containing protein [Sinorhizobium alkalisoli]MCA1491966.1 adenylate/guanylate cyclase domain-containing protein [Ensifer sp. NBAIM29]MCG5479435.1 adenylate/guanylate cyclase domain-containing protein [Sinorhizobium alkalisoli]ODR90510.1 adenylate cyclase [Sinorhizobium alkalisoli]